MLKVDIIDVTIVKIGDIRIPEKGEILSKKELAELKGGIKNMAVKSENSYGTFLAKYMT